MRRRSRIGLTAALWFVAALCPRGQVASQPVVGPLGPTVPGGIRRLVVTVPSGGTVTARAFDRQVTMTRQSAGTWEGLIGVDVDQAPGTFPLAIDVATPGGPATHLHPSLSVRPRRFATRRLTVGARFTDPSPEELARIRDEAARLGTLFEAISERRWQGPFVAPVSGTATSNFGARSVFNGQPRAPHAGVDYRGLVVLADALFMTGHTVVIDHGAGLFSLYAHLSRLDVQQGMEVAASTPLGLIGATGRVTGPHLHWAVRLNGARVDPVLLLAALAR
jgi:hypothetical protein